MKPPDSTPFDAGVTSVNRSRAEGAPESRVLGELLATPTFLLTMPSVERLAEFTARAVGYVPGVAECRVCLRGASAQTPGFPGQGCEGCPGKDALGSVPVSLEPTMTCGIRCSCLA